MAWVLIDDEFYDHPKWRTAPGDSIAMWVAAIAWCNRSEEWSGAIPTHKLGALVNVRNAKATIRDLEQRGALHRDGDCHVIHDFAEWQRVEKKKAISEARRAAGRKGAEARWNGKPDGNDDGNSHGKRDALPPTTYNREYISDNSTPENTPTAGDISSRHARIADRYGVLAVRLARLKGITIADDSAYASKARKRISTDPELVRIADLFPTAPDDVIAAALHGEKHSLGGYPRADDEIEEPDQPNATVHQFPRSAAQ